MSFLDLDERLLDVAALVDICYSPIMDVKEFPEADITLVEGAIANQDHLREIRHIRQRTKTLVAFGDCAVTGNVTALRNVVSVDDVLNCAYREHAQRIEGIPSGNGIVPQLLPKVLRVHDVVKVDYFLPGCPPPAPAILEFLSDLLAGRTPATEGRKFGI